MEINPNIFISLESDKALLWDYKNHKQYLLEKSYIDRLMEISSGEAIVDEGNPIDRDFKATGIIKHKDEVSNPSWQWDVLSHIFHIGTQNIPITYAVNPSPEEWVDEYLDYCDEIAPDQPNLLTEKEGKLIELPEVNLELIASTSLKEVFLKRKTCRAFYGRSVSLEDVSTFLHASFGLIHGDWSDLSENELALTGMRKASPSGGGLHPEEAYLVAMNVDGLKPGLYHYRCHQHVLTEIKLGDFENELVSMLWDQYYARGMAFGIFITARFDKAWWKYKHSRAYRNVLYDIGHVSQTSLLTATALGLETWITGAFHDGVVEQFLEVDGINEAALFFIGAGHGGAVTIDETMKKRLSIRKG